MLLNDLFIIIGIAGPILSALWYMVKIFVKHKIESDEWKRDHSERLAKLEGRITEISKGVNNE